MTTHKKIHPGDVLRFSFDADLGKLSLWVNDASLGVIFEDIPRGVSPALAFYGSSEKAATLNYLTTMSLPSSHSPETVVTLDPVNEEIQQLLNESRVRVVFGLYVYMLLFLLFLLFIKLYIVLYGGFWYARMCICLCWLLFG